MERNELKSVLESLLFVADAPVPVAQLADVLGGMHRKEIEAALQELQSEYETGQRGLRLVEVAHGFQMRTPREHADWIKRLYQGRPARMSRATLETLAIVAYKQPITRSEIESIRGVDVDGVLATLLERRLIRIVARKDVPGRPYLYGTTAEFLEMFNLKDLTHLPTLKEMEEMTVSSPHPESSPETSKQSAVGSEQ
jgi:segregation and condensation protein B